MVASTTVLGKSEKSQLEVAWTRTGVGLRSGMTMPDSRYGGFAGAFGLQKTLGSLGSFISLESLVHLADIYQALPVG